MPRLTALVALLLLVALLGACSGGDDDDGGGASGGSSATSSDGGGGDGAATFCDELKTILASDDKSGGSVEQQTRQFANAIAKLKKLDPPDEIAKDWEAVMGVWGAEPAAKVDIEAAQKSGQRVTAYMRNECKIGQG